MDVAPTLLRLFGLDVPADMQGRPFPPWITGGGREAAPNSE